jgi:glycosyltransferase involved in cell wall biosynthesis
VIYQPIEISPIPPKTHQGYVVGSVGITSTQKNFQLLMDAMRTIPDMQLKIAGFNNNECGAYLKEYAAKIGLGDRVEWLGVIDDMPDFYSRIDVLVACGKHEALGRSVVEAMKCRVPVIAMRDGGYIELIGNNERGWLFEKDDVEDLRSNILESKANEWSKILNKAEQHANIVFSRETFSKEIDKLLN